MACHFCAGLQDAMDRIATAMAVIARDRQALLREIDAAKRQAQWSEASRDRLAEECRQLGRRNIALRGTITRMRKQIAELKGSE